MWARPRRAQEDLRAALRAGPRGLTADPPAPSPRLATLSDAELIELFLAPYAPRTCARYRTVLTRLSVAAHQVGHALPSAPAWVVYQWADAGRRAGHQPRTIKGDASAIRGFYRWALRMGVVDVDPSLSLVVPAVPRTSSQRPLALSEVRALLRAVSARPAPWPGLVHLFALAGTRSEETRRARVEDLEVHGGRLVIHLRSRKFDDPHRILVPRRAEAHVRAAVGSRGSGLVFQHRGRWVTGNALYRVMDLLSEEAGLDHRVRPHQLRAAFVTIARDSGVPDRDIAASIGVGSTAQVDYYDRGWRSLSRQVGDRVAEALDS